MATRKNDPNRRFAGIEYHGIPGTTKPCEQAVINLVQNREKIARTRILSCAHSHCLLISVGEGDLVAVKSGFASGYGGEGPRGFSYVLQVLYSAGIDIDEYDVSQELLDRLDASALTRVDIEQLDVMRPVRPMRWSDYIHEAHWEFAHNGQTWRNFKPVIPLAIIDPRIADLVTGFWDSMDNTLLSIYRRLEDRLRQRTRSAEHGVKLLAIAFNGPDSKLKWKGVDLAEQQGRANLFTGAYGAFRNRRAHREIASDEHAGLRELLLLNELFLLEAEAVQRSKRRKSGQRSVVGA